MLSGRQEQAGVRPTVLHCELGPQGDGKHGSLGGVTVVETDIKKEKKVKR